MLAVMRGLGITDPTLETFVGHILTDHAPDEWFAGPSTRDADVVRARSIVASAFVRDQRCEVIVMMDSDIKTKSTSIAYIAKAACEVQGIVGALVSKRGNGAGWGSFIDDGKVHEIFSDELVEIGDNGAVGGALTAIHRSVFHAIIESGMPFCEQGFWPFFMPCIRERNGVFSYQSEDWALTKYAREVGKKAYVAMKPAALHQGEVMYGALSGNGWAVTP